MSHYAFSGPLCALLLALPACSREASIKVESPGQGAPESASFSLEPVRADDQFDLAMRYESGNGIQADDAWAEYWAWRAALQGHDGAREWLRRRAYAEPLDKSAEIVIDVLNYKRKRSYPSAQLWLALAGPSPSATAEARNEARDLVSQGLPVVRERALRGDVWAKYLVGAVSDYAFSDSTEALRWYSDAAEGGSVLAEDSLGHAYDEGRGTSADGAQAMRWFQAAADQGYAPSQAMLGWMNETGHGTAPNPAEAGRWYLKAAQQGMVFAEIRLASLYASGRGVARDDNEALRWYRAAAQQGSAQAAESVRQLEGRKGESGVEASSGPSSLARAAVGGNADAQYRLASMYERGDGLIKNESEAARWYKRAAEQNHVEAQVRLGKLYEAGHGVPKDAAQSLEWYQRAARAGDSGAKARVAQLECERTATTRAFGVLLRCADRASLQAAVRSAGLRTVREDASGLSDVYEGSTLLEAAHTVKLTYSGQGQLVSLVHELPASFDAKNVKRVVAELTSTYGAPAAPSAAPAGDTRQKWTLGDGVELEVVRTKSGTDSYVAFRVPANK